MKRAKTLRTILSLALSCLIIQACDKVSDNGPLDGMWRLTAIHYHTAGIDSVVDMQADKVFWSIQLQLLSIRSNQFFPNGSTPETLARFIHTGDSLLLAPMYIHHRNKDVLITDPQSTISQRVGIDGNSARFAIEQLDKNHLTLQSSYARLFFRKF